MPKIQLPSSRMQQQQPSNKFNPYIAINRSSMAGRCLSTIDCSHKLASTSIIRTGQIFPIQPASAKYFPPNLQSSQSTHRRYQRGVTKCKYIHYSLHSSSAGRRRFGRSESKIRSADRQNKYLMYVTNFVPPCPTRNHKPSHRNGMRNARTGMQLRSIALGCLAGMMTFIINFNSLIHWQRTRLTCGGGEGGDGVDIYWKRTFIGGLRMR